MVSRPTVEQDPLAPLDLGVTAVSALVAIILVVFIPLSVFGEGTFLGFGDTEACAWSTPGAVGWFEDDDGGRPSSGVVGLRDHARSFPTSLEICDTDPGVAVRLAAAVPDGADLLLLLGFLLLTRRLIGTARRHGLFTEMVAARTRTLGWFLLVGSLVAAAAAAAASGVVVSSAVRDVAWAVNLGHFDMPWTLVLVGLGVLTFARVLRLAVALQADHDATI